MVFLLEMSGPLRRKIQGPCTVWMRGQLFLRKQIISLKQATLTFMMIGPLDSDK